MWCDGLKNENKLTGKRKVYYEFDDGEEGEEMFNSKKKRQPAAKKEEVQDVLEILKNKHESGFTPMQQRIWAEMEVCASNFNVFKSR